ncbi:hypothetical protein [Calothrix rhizosoleniae]|uniref:hypothetical protein n=1 Tax=Calothrix rhizosoleniae TaxID=888997 RepID=UPI000B497233|nr:hypothetical protein [Calothrix rhizosoleniae]
MKTTVILKAAIVSVGLLFLHAPQRADAQIVPRPWVSVGSQEGDVTYAVGARALGVGAELGAGPDGSVGVDLLKFINLPVLSPYLGVGYYTEDKGVAVSGGVQVSATDNLFVGVGYNSIRGINGQLGIKF